MDIMNKSTLKTALIAVGAVALALRISPDVARFVTNADNDYFL
jgi:hypothetical protein